MPDPSSQGGSVLYVTVPEQDVPLRPGRLRGRPLLHHLPGRLYGTALAAWTVGLLVATFSLLNNTGARSDAEAVRAPPPVGRISVPLPEPALPLGPEALSAAARP